LGPPWCGFSFIAGAWLTVTPVQFRPSTQNYSLFAILDDVQVPIIIALVACIPFTQRYNHHQLPASLQWLTHRVSRPADRCDVERPRSRLRQGISEREQPAGLPADLGPISPCQHLTDVRHFTPTSSIYSKPPNKRSRSTKAPMVTLRERSNSNAR
jgi:hypothetical protein